MSISAVRCDVRHPGNMIWCDLSGLSWSPFQIRRRSGGDTKGANLGQPLELHFAWMCVRAKRCPPQGFILRLRTRMHWFGMRVTNAGASQWPTSESSHAVGPQHWTHHFQKCIFALLYFHFCSCDRGNGWLRSSWAPS